MIALKPLRLFWNEHPDAEKPLRAWYKLVSRATWKTIVDVRKNYPHADSVRSVTVFNIGGDKYRLIAVVDYSKGRVFVRHMLTHPEYDKGHWKD